MKDSVNYEEEFKTLHQKLLVYSTEGMKREHFSDTSYVAFSKNYCMFWHGNHYWRLEDDKVWKGLYRRGENDNDTEYELNSVLDQKTIDVCKKLIALVNQMLEKKKETKIISAMIVLENGAIFVGRSHFECRNSAIANRYEDVFFNPKIKEGFMNSKGLFETRKDAYRIVFGEGQEEKSLTSEQMNFSDKDIKLAQEFSNKNNANIIGNSK